MTKTKITEVAVRRYAAHIAHLLADKRARDPAFMIELHRYLEQEGLRLKGRLQLILMEIAYADDKDADGCEFTTHNNARS